MGPDTSTVHLLHGQGRLRRFRELDVSDALRLVRHLVLHKDIDKKGSDRGRKTKTSVLNIKLYIIIMQMALF